MSNKKLSPGRTPPTEGNMELGDIFGVRFEGERNFGSTKVKNAPRSDLALSNFEDYCTGDRSHFPAVEELYKTAPVGDGVYNVNEDSTVEFSNVSQVADSLTNCDNSFLVVQ